MPSQIVSIPVDVTRATGTTQYGIDENWSDSASAPTTGGYRINGAAHQPGGSGIITDLIVTSSADASTLLQGEVFVFNAAVTNINDNAAFVVSDTEIKTLCAVIPFTLVDVGNNGACHVQNLGVVFQTGTTADLWFLVRVKNAYTPVDSEVLTVRFKIIQDWQ